MSLQAYKMCKPILKGQYIEWEEGEYVLFWHLWVKREYIGIYPDPREAQRKYRLYQEYYKGFGYEN